MTWDQLNDLEDKIISLRNRSSRSVIQALVLFLFNLRTGNSNKIISSVFKLDNEQSIADYCASVIISFETDILLFQFGLSDLNRDDLINKHFLKEGDTFLLDRGFCDVVCSLEEIVYYVPRRTMRVIARRATIIAGDRSQGVVEVYVRCSRGVTDA